MLSFELFIIDKMNKAGGLLGRKIRPIIRDFGGDNDLAKRAILELIEKDRVNALFGGGSSSVIFGLQPMIEKHNKLFFFSLNNIGMLVSPNIIFCNSTVNNQVLPALEESIRLMGKKVFLLGRKTISIRKSVSYDSAMCHAIVAEYLKMRDCEVAGDVYLKNKDDIPAALEAIKKANASFILCTSSSNLNCDIVNQLHKSGIKTPIVWTRFEFSHLAITGKEKLNNHLFTNSYTRAINTQTNKNFVTDISNALGFAQAIGTHEVSALSALQLWSAAIKKCNSFDTEKMRAALRDHIYIETPQGPLTLDPETLYAYKKSVLVRYDPYGVLQFLWYSPYPLKPEVFPSFKPKDFWLKKMESINETAENESATATAAAAVAATEKAKAANPSSSTTTVVVATPPSTATSVTKPPLEQPQATAAEAAKIAPPTTSVAIASPPSVAAPAVKPPPAATPITKE